MHELRCCCHAKFANSLFRISNSVLIWRGMIYYQDMVISIGYRGNLQERGKMYRRQYQPKRSEYGYDNGFSGSF